MSEGMIGGLAVVLVLGLAALVVASMWKLFTKAGYPGWASLVPIYNTYVLLKIGDNSGWYLIGLLIPLVNVFVTVKMHVDVAKAFGKGTAFGIAMGILPIVFVPILAFTDPTYRDGSGGGPQGAAV